MGVQDGDRTGIETETEAGTGTTSESSVASNVLRWIAYSVLLGLLPIGAILLGSALLNGEVSLSETLSHGELLIIAVAIVAESLRDLRNVKGKFSKLSIEDFKSMVQFFSLIVILCACVVIGIAVAHDFAVNTDTHQLLIDLGGKKDIATDITTIDSTVKSWNQSLMMWVSISIFVLAIVTSGSCKATEKEK